MEIAVTFAPFAPLWAAMWALLHVSYWLTLALALPAAGFLVRLFMIQHDCGHGAFFRTRAVRRRRQSRPAGLGRHRDTDRRRVPAPRLAQARSAAKIVKATEIGTGDPVCRVATGFNGSATVHQAQAAASRQWPRTPLR
jgi:hypothetical protein